MGVVKMLETKPRELRGNPTKVFDHVCEHKKALMVSARRPDILIMLKSDYDKEEAHRLNLIEQVNTLSNHIDKHEDKLYIETLESMVDQLQTALELEQDNNERLVIWES
jgi:hypothetical protein